MKTDHAEHRSMLDGIYARYSRTEKFFSRSAFTFTLLMIFLLYTGWVNRAERLWTPEHGLGYYLGIIGGTLMLLLMLYPLRKRMKWMSGWFPVKYWFQTHIIFGVLGPVLVLLHSSYNLGSMNGRVALFSMLAVAISGLFGRYIYVKIHYGLYGSKAVFEELKTDSGFLTTNMATLLKIVPDGQARLAAFEEEILHTVEHSITGYFRRSKNILRGNSLYKNLESEYRAKARLLAEEEKWSKKEYKRQLKQDVKVLRMHKRALLKLNELNYYERLFSAWHLLHFPLFIMMVITGLIHVYAVHVY